MTVAVYHNTTESRAFHSPYNSCMRALDQRKRAAYAARELRNFSGRDESSPGTGREYPHLWLHVDVGRCGDLRTCTPTHNTDTLFELWQILM